MKPLVLIIATCFLSLNISAQSAQETKTQKKFIEVAFLENGNIVANGKKTTLKSLKPKLEQLQKVKGKVHYYQAPKIKQIHLMKNLDLVKLINSYKLPMIAYADKNFSKIKGQ
jgi:biopolymer transport protein ExbD